MTEPFDISVHWITEDGKLTKGVVHSSSFYDDVVPAKGDILATKWNEEDGEVTHDAWEVVERYNVDNDKGIFWHIVLKSVDLPPDRAEALDILEPAPLMENPSTDQLAATAAARETGRLLQQKEAMNRKNDR